MSDLLEPNYVLVGKLRRELDETVGYLVASIASGEYFQAQSHSDRIYLVLGILDTLQGDEDAVIYS